MYIYSMLITPSMQNLGSHIRYLDFLFCPSFAIRSEAVPALAVVVLPHS